MESSVNNPLIMNKHETIAFSGDQTPEESSWTMYFEDFFEASMVDVGDCNSSSVSDAMSFVPTKKTIHMSDSNKFNIKRTRIRDIPFAHHHHDLEDTASSPSRSPNVYSMMHLLDNNTRHGGGVAGDETTIEERGEGTAQNQGKLLVDLKKKGLCLVPLSMVTNFLG